MIDCPAVLLAALFAAGCAGEQLLPARSQEVGSSEPFIPFRLDDPPGTQGATPYDPTPYDASLLPPAGAPAASPGGGAARAVSYALARLGTPYCWGGTGPSCFDCSGLTRAAWQAGGRSIPRTSEKQAASLAPVALERILPGDVAWRPGHVGIYIGRGLVVSATRAGDVVRAQPLSGYARAFRP